MMRSRFRSSTRRRRPCRIHRTAGLLVGAHHALRDLARAERAAGRDDGAARLNAIATQIGRAHAAIGDAR